MKKIICVFCSFLVLIITGCKAPIFWEFEQETTQIESVYVASINVYSSIILTDPHEKCYDIIREIPTDRIDGFINDIKKVKYSYYFGDPSETYGLGFIVKFKNGEFDAIVQESPAHIKQKDANEDVPIKHYESNSIWVMCDKEEFNKLIAKYNVDY